MTILSSSIVGSRGPKGEQGDKGDKGDKGDVGPVSTPKGPWATATVYSVNDTTGSGGSYYICTSDHTSALSTEPGIGVDWATVWDLMASKGDIGPAATVDLSLTQTGTENTIVNSGGDDVILPEATTTKAGLLSATFWAWIDSVKDQIISAGSTYIKWTPSVGSSFAHYLKDNLGTHNFWGGLGTDNGAAVSVNGKDHPTLPGVLKLRFPDDKKILVATPIKTGGVITSGDLDFGYSFPNNIRRVGNFQSTAVDFSASALRQKVTDDELILGKAVTGSYDIRNANNASYLQFMGGDTAANSFLARVYGTATGAPSTDGGAIFKSFNIQVLRYRFDLRQWDFKNEEVYGNLRVKSHTVATVPTATAGRVALITDEVGGAVLAFADGTDWRRCTDRAIIS